MNQKGAVSEHEADRINSERACADALVALLKVLEPLTKDERSRVMRSAGVFLGLTWGNE